MSRLATTFITGLLAILPIVLTIVLVVWVANIIIGFVGPNSLIGHLLIAIGFGLSAAPLVAYFLGVLIVAFCIYLLGLLAESRVLHLYHNFVGGVMQRIPLIGYIYDLAKRLIAIVERREEGGFKNMRPVWCFFGGEGGAAVLAVLPVNEIVTLGGEAYHVVLIPSAPVPVGGALVYVPVKWVKPADIGIEGLMSIYVAMGVSARQPGMTPTPIIPPPIVKAPPAAPAKPSSPEPARNT